AAEMTLLAGWMAYDLEQHPIAQRYLIQALRLAHAAGDQALGGEILAAMSCHAAYLGDGSGAVDMARAAQTSARRAGSAALLSGTGDRSARPRPDCGSTRLRRRAHGRLAGSGPLDTGLRAAVAEVLRCGVPR